MVQYCIRPVIGKQPRDKAAWPTCSKRNCSCSFRSVGADSIRERFENAWLQFSASGMGRT